MPFTEKNVRLVFGLKLRQLRLDKSYSLAQLSEKCGISISYLNEIEKGKKYPKTEKIISLAAALDVSYDWLISLQLNKKLAPISELIQSNILDELPLDFFGIEASDLIEILSVAPTKLSAFINSIIQISRMYDIRVEHFFYSALRSYQEMIDNYLEETEKEANNFINKYGIQYKGIDRIDTFRKVLEDEYGYTIKTNGFADLPKLASLRYLFIPETKTLILNTKLSKTQNLFILGREIGYNFLKLKDRSYTSSWVEVKKFDHILNNFKAYYFSSAIILHEKNFVKGLVEFSTNVEFDPERLVDLMESYNSNAEMFMLRITNLIPRFFKFNEMFFFRYNNDLTTNTFTLTKDLLLSGLHKQHGVISDFQPCKRWSGITILKELSILQEKNEYNRPICRINRVKYAQSSREYLIISVAHPMYPTANMNCSISVGFEINEKFLRRTKFLNDPKIPFTEIDLDWVMTNSDKCEDDLEKPSVMIRESKTRTIRDAVNELLSNSH